MKNKIAIIIMLIFTLSSCFLNTDNENKKIDNTESNVNNIGDKSSNSGETNTGSINQTNTGEINSTDTGSLIGNKNINDNDEKDIQINEDKKKLKKIIEDKKADNPGNTTDSNTDKSIDELLKDFDEELNIEELLGES